jgi:exodeoxyribonuclease VII small subunit
MSRQSSKSSPPEKDTGAVPSFEQALAELEKIVTRMEGGQLSLEEALAAHKRGLELAKLCQTRLEAAQQQVRILEGDVLKPLSFGNVADDNPHFAHDD